MSTGTHGYTIGVMKVPVEGEKLAEFDGVVDGAVEALEQTLTDFLHLRVVLVEFAGPHLLPEEGGYSALDFLQLGIAEKLERRLDFLLMVTEVELQASSRSYVLALPSQLTNVGILSTKRLSPHFWGEALDEDVAQQRSIQRLHQIMLHTLGHILNMPHSDEPSNPMYDIEQVEDLDSMTGFTPEQVRQMQRNLPAEAREKVERRHRIRFALRQLATDWPAIWRGVRQANPFTLALRLPTMLTTALSVNIVIFFSAETWDVAGTVGFYQLVIFSLIALVVATAMLYRAFGFGRIFRRDRMIAESTVITEATAILSLLLTISLIYFFFFGLGYFATVTIFPQRLMATWPTVDPATKVSDHVKLNMFLSAMGVLAGSLGGAPTAANSCAMSSSWTKRRRGRCAAQQPRHSGLSKLGRTSRRTRPHCHHRQRHRQPHRQRHPYEVGLGTGRRQDLDGTEQPQRRRNQPQAQS